MSAGSGGTGPSGPEARVLFEYAYLRLVPRVHLERFETVGLLLQCPERDYLGIRCRLDPTALAERCPGLDLAMAARAVDAYVRVCEGGPTAGPIGRLPPAERFHWLTTPRSAVLQSSRPRVGLTRDPEALLERLFAEL